MKIIGLIAEYNPFHYGHIYQISKIKEMYPDSLIIAIISTNFTERGDISIINKWDKTKICLDNGVDLVVELPTLYATQSADVFAFGALKILNELKVDTLVFGTECGDIDMLTKLANIQLYNDKYDLLVKKYLDDGLNYPTAMAKALNNLTDVKINKPNDLLGLSYIKEIIKNNYKITPVSIKRTNDYHGNVIVNNIISANLIRNMLNNKEDISKYVPSDTFKYIYQNINLNNAYNYLLYNIVGNKDNINNYLTVNEGIENKLIKAANIAKTWDELVKFLKSKRYTYNNLNRMLIHILLGIKKTDISDDIYIKVLGFNNNSKIYLNKIKKSLKHSLLYGYKPNKSKLLDIEFKSTYIYSLIVNDHSLIDREYKNKPIIK